MYTDGTQLQVDSSTYIHIAHITATCTCTNSMVVPLLASSKLFANRGSARAVCTGANIDNIV
jgi:hypothetical protein